MLSLERYLLIMLALSIIAPRIPILPLGLLGAIRADHLIIIFTLPAIMFKILQSKFYIILTLIFTALFFSGGNSYTNLGTLIGTMYSILFIIQCVIFMEIGGKVASTGDLQKVKLIYLALTINVIVGIVSRITGQKICSEYLNGNILTSPCWLDQYGFSGAPYVFGAHIIAFMFFCLLYKKVFPYLLGLLSLVLGDSRAFFGAFMPASFWQFLKSKLGVYGLVIIILSAPMMLLYSNVKVIAGFAPKALVDRSLGMRLDNFLNFSDWVTIKRFFFGDGFASYLDFALQYGQPGHPDNLYIRVISEIGLIGLLVYCMAFLFIVNRLKLRFTLLSIVFVLGVLVLGLVQESQLANKSGQIIAFLIGLSFIRLTKFRGK